MGPLTLDARRYALAKVLNIQARCNADKSRPEVDILNEAEIDRIEELIEAKTFPNKWSGLEPLATDPFVEFGQSLLFDEGY